MDISATSECREFEPCVLDDDRHVRLEDRREIGIARNDLRVLQIVEAQVQRAPRSDGNTVNHRLAVGEKHRNGNAGFLIAGVEDARRLVGNQRAVGK